MQLSSGNQACPNSQNTHTSVRRQRTTFQRPGATLVLFMALVGLTALVKAQFTSDCHADCATCFSRNDASACMSCTQPDPDNPTMYMTGFTCATSCDTANNEVADDNDMICKKTLTAVEFPCPPTTYNKVTAQSTGSQCLSAGPANYADVYSMDSPGTCLAGHKCVGSSASRSPVARYAIGDVGTNSSSSSNADFEGIVDSQDYSTNGCITTAVDDPFAPVNSAMDASWGTNPLAQYNKFLCKSHGDVCQKGTYCNAESYEETNCEAGRYCPDAYQKVAPTTSEECYEGFYCRSGNYKPTPGGPWTLTDEYNDEVGDVDASLWKDIYGSYCPFGQYCEQGTTSPTDCGIGTFLPFEGAYDISHCNECYAGNYCGTTALERPSGTCDAGYFCEVGATSDQQTRCLSGFYCEAGTFSMMPCAEGQYAASTASDTCEDCPAGSYCQTASDPAVYSLTDCPAGRYCVDNIVYPCPAGTFLDSENNDALSDCTDNPCGAGSACYPLTKKYSCAAGFNCDEDDATTPKPFTDAHGGNMCKPGEFCQSGTGASSTPVESCDAGKYCAEYMASSYSDNCYAGYYCPVAGIQAPLASIQDQVVTDSDSAYVGTTQTYPNFQYDSAASICPQGAYCQAGVTTYTLCPVGTYGPHTGASTVAHCLDCPQGYACEIEGMTSFLSTASALAEWDGSSESYTSNAGTGQCPGGWYCEAGTSEDEETTVNECGAGYACPENVAFRIVCQAGFYQDEEQQEYCKTCDEGYYCDGTDPETKVACPNGFWCEQIAYPGSGTEADDDYYGDQYRGHGDPSDERRGTRTPYEFPCPRGTIGNGECETPIAQDADGDGVDDLDSDGNVIYIDNSSCLKVDEASACTACIHGYYCQYTGQTELEDLILAGYHANANSAGTSVPNPYKCPQAAYCEEGSYTPMPCPNGQMASDVASPSDDYCIPCPRGMFCNFYNMMMNAYEYEYSQVDGSESSYTVHFDVTGAGADGDVGSYGTGELDTMRPDNDYYTWIMAGGNEAWRIADIEGESFISRWYGDCEAGYICLEGATYKEPFSIDLHNGYPCPIGHYCESGAVIERPCPPGTYNPAEKAAACIPCPATYICPDWGIADVTDPDGDGSADSLAYYKCPAGYYCEGGDQATTLIESDTIEAYLIRGTPCPAGRFDSAQTTGYSTVTECSLCSATKYCEIQGLLAETGSCVDGFICIEGENTVPGPFATTVTLNVDGTAAQSGKCAAGYFCASTALDGAPTTAYACDDIDNNGALGYYQPGEQSTACLLCPPGSYCTDNLTARDCAGGSYCSVGSYTYAPRDGEQGDKCDAQHKCPAGSGLPIPCEDDEWQPLEGQESCNACDAGYVCRNSQKDLCPEDRICDRDQDYLDEGYIYGHLCANGFYTDGEEGYDSEDYCNSCDPGYFCMGGQKTGECAAGYICIEEADTHTPDIDNKAYPCPMGYYCEPGSSAPQRCPIKTYTFQEGAKQLNECTDCKMGYYCNYDQIEPKICPQGAYCGIGVTEPTWCPRGTYNPIEGMGAPGDCKPCRGGYNCDGRAIGNLLKYPQYICPGGHFCPRGIDIDPIPCIAGSYLPEGGNPAGSSASFDESFGEGMGTAASVKDCQLCPEHFYCPRGTADPLLFPCPDGRICPPGHGEPLLCPAGYYCQRQGAVTAQLICPEGNFCPMGSSTPMPCDPDKVCREGSASEFSSSMLPSDCNPGEYLNVNTCSPCEPGFVCVEATSQKYPICTNPRNGQFCTASDGGEEGGFECPKGHYCPGGTREPSKCPAGRYRNTTRGKSIDDCLICPDGSASQDEGSEVCLLCGRGAESNEDKTKCQCKGAFRTWQPSLNACVCEQGYIENEITIAGYTSTEDLDCRPNLRPNCPTWQFVDQSNRCVAKSSCSEILDCGGQGGEYNSALEACFCPAGVEEGDPGAFCDAFCQEDSLKAYYVPPTGDRLYGYIQLQLKDRVETFSLATFENTMMLDGLSCEDSDRCLLESIKNDPETGEMVTSAEAAQGFINAWLERGIPYDSPYGSVYVPPPGQESFDDAFGSLVDEVEEAQDERPSLESLIRAQRLHRSFGRNLSDEELRYAVMNSTNSTTVNATQQVTEQSHRRRLIGADSSPQGASIICVKQNGSVTFSANRDNYPVYVEESIYNTNPNYDYGLLTKLKTKLITANLQISEFMMTFTDVGQVYVFGRSTPPAETVLEDGVEVPVATQAATFQSNQMIVKVVESIEEDCGGEARWPATAENLIRLGIQPNADTMARLSGWTQMISPLFVLGAFALLFWQQWWESRNEAAEADRRARREGISVKYFKKKSDKFDKLEYIADLYKFIAASLTEIQQQIELNDRLEREENKQNMRRMLRNKYSIFTTLDRSTGKSDMEDIDAIFHDLLDHLRFSDGRGVREVMEERKLAEEARLAEEEELARRAALQQDDDAKSVDSFQSDSMASKPSSRAGARFGEPEEEVVEEENLNIADPQLMDDLVKAKADMNSKRDAFIATMDGSLTEDEKADLLAKFDAQMNEMTRQLQRQQEDEDQNLKNRLMARKKKRQDAAAAVKEGTKEVQDEMNNIQSQIARMQEEHDDLCDDDINTHDLKKERNKEFKARMQEFETENDKRLKQIRDDYSRKVAAAKDPSDKELILEEMSRRLKSVEDQFADDKKRQEANLMKMLKARQKKQKAAAGKHLGKEIEKLEEKVDELQGQVDVEKAKVYAEQGADNLVDEAIKSRKARVADKAIGKDVGFDSELTKTEQEDIEITKSTLEIEKQKKLNMAEAAIEEEIDIEQSFAKEEAQATSDKIRRTIAGTDDPEEKARLLAQLAENDRQIQLDMQNQAAAQDRLLQERLKRKRHMIELRKLKIERDQLDEVNAKEIEINQKKFDKQIGEIEKKGGDELDKQLRNTMTRNVSGNEKGLILIDQSHDELLARKLKILVSKQFFELSKYLATLQQQIALDRMIKTKEIEAEHQKKKGKLVASMRGQALEDELAKLQAEKHLEHSLIDEKLRQEHLEKESEIRCKNEKIFGDEKKDMQRHEMRLKKEKIQAAMKNFKEDALVQEIGEKMLKRIDNSIDWQMKEIDDATEKKLEEARLRIVADNEEELRMLQDNLDMAMEKEKVKVEATINARSADVLARKKENLEERLKMVSGEMTEMQIKALRQQMEAEYNAVEKAIEEEKKNQLQKMRGAMLSRRIQKERRRKEEIRKKEEVQRRKNLQNMKSGLAKAFTNMIKKKTEEQRQANLMTRSATKGADSQLEAKLRHWNKELNTRNIYRDDEHILERESPEDAAQKAKREAEEKAKMDADAAAEAAGLKYTLEELYKRVLKVERLSEKVRSNHGAGLGGSGASAKVMDLAAALRGNNQ